MKAETYGLLRSIEKKRAICENAILAITEYQTKLADSESISEAKIEIQDSFYIFKERYAELQRSLLEEDKVNNSNQDRNE